MPIFVFSDLVLGSDLVLEEESRTNEFVDAFSRKYIFYIPQQGNWAFNPSGQVLIKSPHFQLDILKGAVCWFSCYSYLSPR
jgi:hypothetical protein